LASFQLPLRPLPIFERLALPVVLNSGGLPEIYRRSCPWINTLNIGFAWQPAARATASTRMSPCGLTEISFRSSTARNLPPFTATRQTSWHWNFAAYAPSSCALYSKVLDDIMDKALNGVWHAIPTISHSMAIGPLPRGIYWRGTLVPATVLLKRHSSIKTELEQ
jgi:hypothetical protein